MTGALAITGISWGGSVPEADARPTGPLVPPSGTLFGAWMERDDATNMSTKKAMWSTREAEIGRRFDIAHHFYPFHNSFPGWIEEWDIQMGRIPSIGWGAVDTRQVNQGVHDALIRTRARGVKALGAPVFLRWFWEMDGAYQASIAHTPADYIAAWKRVRRIFREEGATNAVWTWCTTSWGMTAGYAQQWYPGDDEVDWICSNGYNFAPLRTRAPWESWETIYRATHDFAVLHDKPMMAGEWGALERGDGEKAAWIADAAATIAQDMPNLAAVVAFDERKWESRETTWFDWEVDSSPSSKLAFMAMARHSWFTKRTPEQPPTVSIGDSAVWEGNAGSITQRFAVSLSAPTSETVTVRLRTSHVSTTSADLEPVDRVIAIEPGRTRVETGVSISGDTSNENHERYTVTLSAPNHAVLGDASARATIWDEDPLPSSALRLGIGDATVVEGDTSTRTIRLPITLSRAASGPVTVSFGVLPDGTTEHDFEAPATGGTLTIPRGARSGSVLVVVKADFHPEATEHVVVAISHPTVGVVHDAVGVLTIVDDD